MQSRVFDVFNYQIILEIKGWRVRGSSSGIDEWRLVGRRRHRRSRRQRNRMGAMWPLDVRYGRQQRDLRSSSSRACVSPLNNTSATSGENDLRKLSALTN